MSVRVQPYRVDDLAILKDPKAEVPAAETIRFSLNGKDYEMDLSAPNARAFWKAVRPYADAARVIRPSRRPRTAATRVDSARVRDWAIKQGFDVKRQGRVPADIVAQYELATSAA
jgi:hypothetical protein